MTYGVLRGHCESDESSSPAINPGPYWLLARPSQLEDEKSMKNRPYPLFVEFCDADPRLLERRMTPDCSADIMERKLFALSASRGNGEDS